MGCVESKNAVTSSPREPSTPQDGRNNNHIIGCTFTREADRRASDHSVVPGGAHPTPDSEAGYERSSPYVILDPPVDRCRAGRKMDSLVMKYPVNSLRKLKSGAQSSMAIQMLQERQRIANAKREAVIQRKQDFAQKVSTRGDVMITQTESEQKTTTFQIQTRVRMSDILRAAKHKEILDRQKLSEQRTRLVRERQLEPLNYPTLTADMLLAKQRAAEEKRLEVLKKRSEISHTFAHRKLDGESVRRNLYFDEGAKQHSTSDNSLGSEHEIRRCTCKGKNRRVRIISSDMK